MHATISSSVSDSYPSGNILASQSAIATLSILLNIGIFTYARSVVSKLLNVSNELYDLGLMITSPYNTPRMLQIEFYCITKTNNKQFKFNLIK